MGHGAQAFGGNQLARLAADAVRLVLDAHQGGLQALDELQLTLGQAGGLFLGQGIGAFLQHLVRGGSVVRVITVRARQAGFEHIVVTLGQLQLVQDDGAKFF